MSGSLNLKYIIIKNNDVVKVNQSLYYQYIKKLNCFEKTPCFFIIEFMN